jgi:hypothetical protein
VILAPIPLPIRLEPLPEEGISSYLARVGEATATDLRVLLKGLGFGRSGPIPTSWIRNHGYGAKTDIIEYLATFLNLSVDEVAAMFADHSPLVADLLPAGIVDAIDLRAPSNLEFSYQNWDLPAQFRPAPKARACPECLANRPNWWHTGWYFRHQLICEKHNLLLAPLKTLDPRTPTPDVLRAQRIVTDVALRGAAAGGLSREEYLRGISSYLQLADQTRAGSADGNWLVDVVTLLATPDIDLVPTTGHPMSKDNHLGLAVDLAVAAEQHELGLFNGRYHQPPAARPHDRRWLPRLITMGHYAGALSDLAYPSELLAGRQIASLHLRGTSPLDPTSSATGTPDQARTLVASYLSLMTRLDISGHWEAWWEAIDNTRSRIVAEGIDYRSRALLVTDPNFLQAAQTQVPRQDRFTVRSWLFEWAGLNCDTPKPSPIVEDFGHRWGAHLQQHLLLPAMRRSA